MGKQSELEQNVGFARSFKPMTKDEASELKKETNAVAKQWGAHFDKLDSKGEKNRPLINT